MALEATLGDDLDLAPPESLRDPGVRIQPAREIRQRADHWCWAASIESARLTTGQGRRKQHLIVADHLPCDSALCDSQPGHEDCDQTVQPDELQGLWRKQGFGQAVFEPRTLSMAEIREEIGNRRLVQLELSNRHVVLVYGWEVDEGGVEIVHIIDTIGSAGPPHWNFRDLDNFDPWGAWTGSCFNLEYDGSGVT